METWYEVLYRDFNSWSKDDVDSTEIKYYSYIRNSCNDPIKCKDAAEVQALMTKTIEHKKDFYENVERKAGMRLPYATTFLVVKCELDPPCPFTHIYEEPK